MTNCALIPFVFDFIVYDVYNFGVCTIWQFLFLLRRLEMTQKTVYNFVIVFCVIV